MANLITIKDKNEYFGFGNVQIEILNAIQQYMGREFADFVEENLITNYSYCLEDIIMVCDSYIEGEDDIKETLDEIKLMAQNGLEL